MEKNLRILIYEDNAQLREGMSFLFQATPGMELVAAFGDTHQVAIQVKHHKPDLIVMDVDLPGVGGIEATAIAKAVCPETQVLILTVFEEEEKIFRAIRNGAGGYLLKSTPPGEIIEAIHDIRRGGSPLTASVARKVLQHFQQQQRPLSNSNTYQLSARELEILRALTKGHSYKLVADELNISIDTVRSHIRHIYEKLQVNSKSEAVLKALREGLVEE